MPRIPTGFMWDAVYVTGGFIATKMAAGWVLPMLGVQQPIFRVVTKAGVAWGLGWVGGAMLGRSAGNLVMVGGFVEAINDAFQTFLAPMMPALGDYSGMGSYPTLSSYASLGDGYDSPYAVSMGQEYDE